MSQAPPSDKKKTRSLLHAARRTLPLILLLWVVAGAYFYWQHWDTAPEHVPAAAPAHVMSVDVVTVQYENVPVRVRFLGQTEAALLVEIRARVAGYLEERTFTEGQLVEKGQKLFQIDPRPFEVQVAQAAAGLASAGSAAATHRATARAV